MAPAEGFFHIKVEGIALLGPVEAVQQPQPFLGVHAHTPGIQRCKPGPKICIRPVEEKPCFFQILSDRRYRNILFLDEAGASGLAGNNTVVFLTVFIPAISLHGHQNGFGEIPPVHAVIVDQDLGSRVAVQAVQNSGIAQKHIMLILIGGNLVVDIAEAIGFGIGIAAVEDAVVPDAVNGDQILNPSGDPVPLPALLKESLNGFDHGIASPFFCFLLHFSSSGSKGSGTGI